MTDQTPQSAPWRPKPGELWRDGRRLYGICTGCCSIVRFNKPILGSLHVCK